MFKNKKVLKIAAFISLIAILTTAVAIFIASETQTWDLVEAKTNIYWLDTNNSLTPDEALKDQIRLFSTELKEKLELSDYLQINFGPEDRIGDNDIVLKLDSSLDIPTQGYKISFSGSQLWISASDADGLFYGCRYVIKQLKYNDAVESTSSSPDVLERGLSLDNGRKYYSVDWIKEMIRELSWADMNTLVLHFSEEMGWGIESLLYPKLAGRDGILCTQAEIADDERYLTQDEIREIVEYADMYHVEIIPSIDSPGHLNYLVKWFNEQCADKSFTFTSGGKTYTAPAGTNIGNYFSYNGKTTAVVPGSRNGNYSRGIDISNEIAVAFVKSLIEEYGKLFYDLGCRKFDIGGDELLGWGAAVTTSVSKWKQLDHWKAYAQSRTGNSNAVAYDAFLLYMNDLNALVRSLGYTSVRMWNDDALRSSDTGWTGVVQLDTDIDIWFWTTGTNKVSTYTNAGYEVYNILSDYNYYAMTSDYFSDNRGSFNQSYADQIYNEWTPYTFGSGGNTENGVLGSAFGIWSDNPSLCTEDKVMSDVLPMLRSHGAKAWDAKANDNMTYEEFNSYLNVIGNCPDSSSLSEAPEITNLYVVESVSFKTTRVRDGGTAVMKVVTTNPQTDFALAAPDGSAITDFEVVTLNGEENVYYLKFKVSGIGKQTYTVTVNGVSATATLKLWK